MKEFVEKQFGSAREVDRLTLLFNIQRVKKSKIMELTWLLIITRL